MTLIALTDSAACSTSQVPILYASQQPSSRGARAVRWVHVPKTGSAFVNTVVRLGCAEDLRSRGTKLPAWAGFRVQPWLLQALRGDPGGHLDEWLVRRVPEHHRAFMPRNFNGTFLSLSDHLPIIDEEAQRGDLAFVALLRSPTHRLVSEWFAYGPKLCQALAWQEAHGIQPLQAKGNCTLAQWAALHTASTAEAGPAGCQVKMLVGRRCHDGPYPNQTEVEEAKARLARFAFVGRSEDWNGSNCSAVGTRAARARARG